MLFKSLLRNIVARAFPKAAARAATQAERLAEGRARFDANDLVRAQLLFKDVHELDPEHRDALHFLGLIGPRVRDLAFSREHFERSIQARPGAAVFLNHFGSAPAQVGRTKFREQALSYLIEPLERLYREASRRAVGASEAGC